MSATKQLLFEMLSHEVDELFEWAGKPRRLIRAEVLRRAAHSCEDCGADSVRLELHHEHYRSVGREIPSDYAALCRHCHHHRHRDLNGSFWVDPDDKEDAWFGFHWEMDKD